MRSIAAAIMLILSSLFIGAMPAEAGAAGKPTSLKVNCGAPIAEGLHATCSISKAGGNGKAITVSWHTEDRTAHSPSDYAAASGSMKLGTAPISVVISTHDDSAVNGSRAFSVVAAYNAVRATGTVTISDNDVAPEPPPTQTCPDGSVIPATSVCPAPVPPPVLAQVDIPAPSIAGLTLLVPHDPNTDLKPVTDPTPDAGIDPVGAYRQTCGDGFFAYADPVLLPGQWGLSHLHDFSGAKFMDIANATPDKVIASEVESTCNNTGKGHASQLSLYWVAALLDGQGNVIRPDYNTVYYKRVPSSYKDCGVPTGIGSGPVGICTADLGGLQMIAGMNPANGQYGPANFRNDSGRYVYFSCSAGATANARFSNLEDIAAANPTCTELTEVIEFPMCSDGKYLWKVDRSHLAYMVNYNTDGKFRCPPTNPYWITQVTIHYVYSIDANWQTYDLSCTPMLRMVKPTAKRGECIHADAMLIWDIRVKQKRQDGCIEQHLNCSAGILDRVSQLIGAAQPVYGFRQPASQRLVPLSSIPRTGTSPVAGKAVMPSITRAGERGR